MNNELLIRVDGVSKKFCRSLKKSLWYGLKDIASEAVGRNAGHKQLRSEEFWAVNDVSFELQRGECLGLIGSNGAGKTTLLKMLNGLIKPDKGKIEINGRVGALIALGAGFNPVLTGRENIYVNGSVLGLSKKEIDAKLEEIIDFADIHEFIDAPVQNYSSGMQVRLGFAVATTLQPDVLLLDEVLAVGDAGFRHKCYSRIGQMQRNATVIFVSHNMEHVSQICDRVLYLQHGRGTCYSYVSEGIAAYQAQCEASTAMSADRVSAFHYPITGAALSLDRNSVKYGKKIVVCLVLDVMHEFINPIIGLAIRSEHDHVAAIWNTQHHGVKLEIPAGRNEIRFKIGPLYLLSGNYNLSLSIREDGSAEHKLWFHNKVQFKVIGQILPVPAVSFLLPYHGHDVKRIASTYELKGDNKLC